MSHTIQLPLEIIYHVIDNMDDDLPTLRQCALTNKALLACARANLYRHITLNGYAYEKAQLLSRTLRAEPTLGSLIRSLRISRLIYPDGIAHDVYLTPDLLPFHLLNELREFTLHWMQLQRVDELITIVAALPRLERFVCDTLVDESPAPLPLEYAAMRALEAENVLRRPTADPALFPRLKELVIKHGPWSHLILAQKLLLTHRTVVEGLHLIDISFGGTGEALAWVPVIRAAGPRLQSLSISMTDRSARHTEQALPLDLLEQYKSDHAYVLDNLSHCSTLRSLRLKYHPHAFASLDASPPPEFLESLCETFERHPPPFPLLEHLELWMVDRDGLTVSVTAELIARLARSLLDRRRYAHFSRLSVRIQPQYWVSHLQVWSTRYNEGRAARQAMVERWRATFAAFERVPGVVLDVDLLHSPRSA
ncbi:hypothetical protein OH77DRAFT_1001993 [Trametes cingulata]|nr:hypothetical protein OH77DRAFT_1001993 [Trametes cingulata]